MCVFGDGFFYLQVFVIMYKCGSSVTTRKNLENYRMIQNICFNI